MLFHLNGSLHQGADVDTRHGDRQQTHGGEHRETATHIVGDDISLVTLHVGQLFQGTFGLVGDGDDARSGFSLTIFINNVLLQDAESDGRFGRGALKQLANVKGYKTYIVPDDVGGRFSVLTPVGLLPIAMAGIDIRALVKGAVEMEKQCKENQTVDNPVSQYAVARQVLYAMGKTNEIMVNYEPRLVYFSEWWKQLYGESHGKQHKGVFPASVTFSTDLHSMGQYIQDGLRNLFETVISVENSNHELRIPMENEDLDQLNYIAGKRISEVNHKAELGTILAHEDGGVPNIRIVIPEVSAKVLGELIYFFEMACAVSGYLLDVNPFDQPGVEAYKKNMFALLGKKGFEEQTAILNKRLGI